jgi:hypothetical protein
MADSKALAYVGVDRERLAAALDRLIGSERPRYRRLWTYFKNPMRVCGVANGGRAGSERPYRQGQEWGLPPRITGVRCGAEPFADGGSAGTSRKEVVVENDIAWRVDTMVDYLFGRPVVITSAAPDPARRELIGRVLRAILANNGGVQFFQQLATLGSVYGFVDVLVKAVGSGQSAVGSGDHGNGRGPPVLTADCPLPTADLFSPLTPPASALRRPSPRRCRSRRS